MASMLHVTAWQTHKTDTCAAERDELPACHSNAANNAFDVLPWFLSTTMNTKATGTSIARRHNTVRDISPDHVVDDRILKGATPAQHSEIVREE